MMQAMLPYPAIRRRWVRVSKEPISKRIGKYTMIVDKAYHRVEAGGRYRRAIMLSLSTAALGLASLAISVDRAIRPSVGVSASSIFAPAYRAVAAWHRSLLARSWRLEIHSIKVAYVRDHPFLSELNALPHVPRAVKAIYRGSVRLAHMQATEGWPVYRAMDAAHTAWEEYIKTAKENHP